MRWRTTIVFFYLVVLKEFLHYLGPNAKHVVPNMQALSLGHPFSSDAWYTPEVVPSVMGKKEETVESMRDHNRSRDATLDHV